jgi:flavin-binding protein dodecin
MGVAPWLWNNLPTRLKNSNLINTERYLPMVEPVAKVTELVGQSEKGWQDAVEAAVAEAAKTIRGITGVEVRHLTGIVKEGRIVVYRADVKIAYGVERPNVEVTQRSE